MKIRLIAAVFVLMFAVHTVAQQPSQTPSVPATTVVGLQVGDIVQLTAGGPQMTVTTASLAAGGKPATCDVIWHDAYIAGDFKTLKGLPQACFRKVIPNN